MNEIKNITRQTFAIRALFVARIIGRNERLFIRRTVYIRRISDFITES